jgi:hypothetical protein
MVDGYVASAPHPTQSVTPPARQQRINLKPCACSWTNGITHVRGLESGARTSAAVTRPNPAAPVSQATCWPPVLSVLGPRSSSMDQQCPEPCVTVWYYLEGFHDTEQPEPIQCCEGCNGYYRYGYTDCTLEEDCAEDTVQGRCRPCLSVTTKDCCGCCEESCPDIACLNCLIDVYRSGCGPTWSGLVPSGPCPY